MRRRDRELSEDAAMAILHDSPWGVLSIVSETCEPYSVPLNYCMIDGAIYFHCAIDGRKIDCLAANHTVSFCVVGEASFIPSKFTSRYQSTLITGRVLEVEEDEKQAGLEALVEKYSADYMEEGRTLIDRLFDKTRVYKIIIESITGKAANLD